MNRDKDIWDKLNTLKGAVIFLAIIILFSSCQISSAIDGVASQIGGLRSSNVSELQQITNELSKISEIIKGEKK